MQRVLIVHASRHGGTAGIADRIGTVMRSAGLEAVVAKAADMPDPQGFDGCLVGAGVYMGSWVKEGTDFLDRYAATLAGMPVWLFSSGPLPGSSKEVTGVDPIENALGPAEGPGSGGRRRIEGLADVIRPREHRVFQGVFDPNDSPKTLPERVVRMLPVAKGILPVGDFREWPLIEQWALEIAGQLRSPVAAG
jgi:menaquinone-dependent protoporphyrinogen oxidase